ncbi:hypothetical protein PHYSODRAFT_288783 [Phytophthora sojae]|uniref:RxLR effector protein n=2 Tax=Phytophthora sojae TaxID=67593 RepID=G5A7W1_PHYSP|nr:hypothetical protein PHYSODRAFT_288783 [Phytophthora sojae]AEK80736.1 Avh141 [Phytophthora sojae]EGZ07987.1 hypothetical protein PHYSODRAFT_288783 [Phytophthora sojae]|eukprot:XP_009536159.1 hypothetical protein PHYSODRAFT_288783 [Phytophthora sojae]
MRVHHVVLLVAAAILATTNAALTLPQFMINSPKLTGSLLTAQQQRFLRTPYTEDDSIEERGISTVVEKTKALLSSSKVSEQTLERWVRNDKSPKKALIRLKLDKAGDKLLEKPQFETWAKYMTMLNKENPEAAMISTLRTRYSDDVLSQMTITAETASGTKEMAARLQAGQRSVWMSEWKSADDVFKLLKLNVNKADRKLFANPQFTVWTKYVDDLNGGETKKANSVIVSTLTDHHGDEGLAKLIRAAKDVEETKTLAMDLQKAQVDNWFVAMESPKDVKKWLGVKGATSDTAEAQLYHNYVKNYEKIFRKTE